jgi:uncharacterized protein (UPF0332 family)
MARYHVELLAAAQRLLTREEGQRGRIASARVRRSISTTYYALFHFILEECTNRVVGVGPALLRRRRIAARIISHKGLKRTLSKVGGGAISPDLRDYFGIDVAPDFIRDLSKAILQAQDQRLEADYDLNASFSEATARTLIDDVRAAIDGWQAGNDPASRDFKHALSLLLVLQGQLRRDDA